MKRLLLLLALFSFQGFASESQENCESIESDTWKALCYVKQNETFLSTIKDGFNFTHRLPSYARCGYAVSEKGDTGAGICIDDPDHVTDEVCLIKSVRTTKLANKYNKIYKDVSIGGFRLQFKKVDKECMD